MKATHEQNMPIRYYSAVTVRKVDWLWYPFIPYGKITIIQGDPGDGKTTLILNMAAMLSNGMSMPASEQPSTPAKIIYQSAEDGAEDTIKPRLMSAEADCSKIAFIDDSAEQLTLSHSRIESALRETGAKLLVIDPFQAYIGENSDMNRADGVRPMMKRLAAVADRTGCAIVIVGHMNKSSGSKGIYRGLGSIDITAAARSVLLVARIKQNPSVRVMAQLKNSLAEESCPVAFEINDDSSVRWIGRYDISVEELLSGDGAQIDSPKLSEAIYSLKDMLSDGESPCVRIYEKLQGQGVSKRSVDRAKKTLNIKSVKHDDGWYWLLPTEKM
jgi:hypothetical protein